VVRARPAERLDLADHLAAKVERRRYFAVGVGFGNIIQSAERQGLEADFGIASGQRRDHQHARLGPGIQQQRQRFEAVHHRHLDIQQNDVGGAPDDIVDRQPAIGVARHDYESGLFVYPAHDEPAHHRRIVDDHHLDGIGGRRCSAGRFYRGGIHARYLTEQVSRNS
jgi:hypothetical protein